MYKYSKKALLNNLGFVAILLFILIFIKVSVVYKIVLALVTALIVKDAYKEMNAAFELKGDRLLILNKEEVTREIKYRDMQYLTITRRNKKWIVIADDERILFVIKPRIENYQDMVGELIRLNQSNKKLDVNDYIMRTYKKPS